MICKSFWQVYIECLGLKLSSFWEEDCRAKLESVNLLLYLRVGIYLYLVVTQKALQLGMYVGHLKN